MNDKDVIFIVTTPIPILLEKTERHLHILMHREDFYSYRADGRIDYYMKTSYNYQLRKLEITIELNHEEG